MKKTIFTISIIFLTIFSLSAQSWTDNLDKDKLQKGELTLLDYEKAFNDYWEPYHVENGYYYVNGEKTKAPGWKLFKRWVWKMEFYCDAEGNFPKTSTSEELRKYYKKYPTAVRSASGSWSNIGYNATPGGYQGVGRVNTVAFHPTDNNTFWIGSPSGGTWKTTDGGSTWTVLTDDQEVLGVSAIAIPSDYATSSTIYIGTGDRDGGGTLNSGMNHQCEGIGVLKSTDGGSTWNTTGLSFPQSNLWVINDLLILPSDNNTIYAATNVGLYKTTNGGVTWPLIVANGFIDLEFKPGDPTVMYGAKKDYWGDGNIYRSTDGGANFTPIALPGSSSRRTEIAVSADDPTVVYALTVNSSYGLEGIYKSTDSGASFSLIYSVGGGGNNLMGYDCADVGTSGQGTYDLFLTTNPNDVNDVYAGGINVWRTTDGGSTWTIKSHWSGDCGGTVNTVHADQHFCGFQSGGNVFIGNDGGIYKSTDNGSSWNDLSNGLTINQIYRIGVSSLSSDEIINGLQDNGTHLYSGGTWVPNAVIGGDGMECLIDPTDDDVQFGETPSGGIKRTYDHWAYWYTQTDVRDNIRTAAGNTGLNGAWVTPYMLDPNNNNNLFVGFEELWKSTDQGVTSGNFSQISNFGGGDIKALQIAKSNSNYIFVGFDQHLYKTTDGGTSWSDITGSLPIVSNKLTYIAVKNDDENTVWVTIGGFNGDAVYETTDGGATWTNISAGLPQLPAMSIVQNTQNTTSTELYVSMSGGVWVKNGAANWAPFNTNIPSVFCAELDIYYDNTTPANSRLRVGTFGRGLWESDLYTPPAPVADFEADNTVPTSEFDWVHFTDLSTNTPTSWLWTITPATHTYINGTSNTSQNPDVSFDVPGAYTVALTATNATGSDTETKTDYIHMGIPGDWTGATDDDWNTTTNWDNYMVPVSSTDVNIPTAAANYPFYDGDFTIGTQCNQITMEDATEFDVSGNLTIAPGKALYCADGATIYVGGDWTDNGTFDPVTGTVDFYGTNPSTINIPNANPVYLIDDDFTTWPGNWNGDIAGGTGQFGQSATNNAGGSSPEAMFTWESVNTTRQMYYNAVNTTGLTSLTLDFRHYVDDYTGSGYIVKVQYSTDGTTWFDSDWSLSPTGDVGPEQVSTVLTAASHAVGSATYYISFTITGNLGSLDYWYIDDVKLYYTPAVTDETFYNLTISKESALTTTNGNSTLNVNNDLTVLPDAWFTNSTGNTVDVTGDILLEADAVGTASFIDNGTTNYGIATVESYISEDQYHMVSAPINNGVSNTFLGLYLSYYQESDGTWHDIIPTDYDLVEGTGYFVWSASGSTGNAIVNYPGVLNNGDIIVSGLSYTPSQPESDRGWNIVGNPYPSATHWSAAWGRTNVDATAYIFDGVNYLTWNTAGTGTHPTGDIATGQGFWVKANNTGASLTIPQSERKHSTQVFYKSVEQLNQLFLTVEGNGYSDKMIVKFDDQATSGFDSEFDAWKFKGNGDAPQLYSVYEGNQLTVNILPFTDEKLIIPVYFEAGMSGQFLFKVADLDNFDVSDKIWLEDLRENEMINLRKTDSYSFQADPDDNFDRFLLHFTNTAFGIDEKPVSDINIYSYGSKVYITSTKDMEGEIKVFNFMGVAVYQSKIMRKTAYNFDLNVSTGYYLVSLNNKGAIKTKVVFIK